MPRKTFREMVEALTSSPKHLRGSVKLAAALDGFGIDVTDRICLDVGASTGGFTSALLQRGAKRVYAVDAGHGQLLGSLRQDARVVNLENTNVAALSKELVPEVISLVTVDVSYLALREAVRQLAPVDVGEPVELVGLVKPMFELALASAPTDRPTLDQAIEVASAGIAEAGWVVLATMPSPVSGAKGAIEGFVHARRSPG